MGLILPSEGSIYFNIDDSKGSKDILTRWQEKISFVPQKVFIIEDTVNQTLLLVFQKMKLIIRRLDGLQKKYNYLNNYGFSRSI